MFKILIYSIIILVASIAVFLANYAMVFHVTATIVSLIAVLISLGHLFIALFTEKGWKIKEKHFIGMWSGLLLFSMHQIISSLAILLLLYLQTFLAKKIASDVESKSIVFKPFDKFKMILPEIAWISFAFFLLDTIREFTVWKKWEFQLFPFSIFLLVLFMKMILSKKTT